MIYADKATLTGSGSFTGMIDVNKNGFINNSSGKLNAMVILNDADDYGNCIIYGERSTADISPDYPIILSSEGNFLTIAPGATLTVNDVGEDTPGLIISDTTKLSNQGTLVNNGTVGLADAAAEGDVSAYIKSLGLTGSGTVQVATKNVDGEDVLETYTNSGLRLRDTAGTLDLSNPTNLPEDGAAKGYSWDEATKTLTIQEGFNAEKVLLPDDTVTIVTAGESIIKELAVSGNNPISVKIV